MSGDIKYKVKSLYEIMKDEKLQELEINSEDYSVYIKRKDKNEFSAHGNKAVVCQASSVDIKKNDAVSFEEIIKSPIAGIFYKSPSPTSPMFVSEGDVVEIGRTICIIEAMKVMNEIKVTFKAKIVQILIENGKTVDLGQNLFKVKKI
jgi:acetyl-CoA carboxylase biotin carboxyl carrier protein